MSYSAAEDVVNAALDRIGYPKHIADMYEGSPAARAALEIYGQTRDSLLASEDWPFALREVLLVPSGQTPPTPWKNEYIYPSDCLRIRYIRPGALSGGTRSQGPQPVLYTTYNDIQPMPKIQAILCDLNPATLYYVGQITNPGNWEVGFTEAFIGDLAVQLAPMLANSPEMQKAAVAMAMEDRAEGQGANDMTAPKQASNGNNR